jgi:hypothetical protein
MVEPLSAADEKALRGWATNHRVRLVPLYHVDALLATLDIERRAADGDIHAATLALALADAALAEARHTALTEAMALVEGLREYEDLTPNTVQERAWNRALDAITAKLALLRDQPVSDSTPSPETPK